METAFHDDLTPIKVIVGVSNNRIKMWSISVFIALLYTCMNLNSTMLSYQSLCSVLQQ